MRTIGADDLADMALFAVVVEERSFTAAARRVRLSKSALSARIARLERSAGVRLLHRTTRRVSVTDAGAALYPRCAKLASDADDIGRALLRVHDGTEEQVRGTVRVSTAVVLAQRVLPDAIAAASRRYPQLRVELIADDALVDIVHGGFDVVIRIARQLPASLVGRKLGRSDEIVCASPAYLEERGVPQRPADLVSHRCLRFRFADPKTEWRFVTKRGVRSVDVSGPMVSNHDPALVAAAKAGMGIVIMPRFYIDDDLKSGALVEVLAHERPPPVTIWALHPWRKKAPPRVRALVDAVASEMKRIGAV